MIRAILTSGSMRSLRRKPGQIVCYQTRTYLLSPTSPARLGVTADAVRIEEMASLRVGDQIDHAADVALRQTGVRKQLRCGMTIPLRCGQRLSRSVMTAGRRVEVVGLRLRFDLGRVA